MATKEITRTLHCQKCRRTRTVLLSHVEFSDGTKHIGFHCAGCDRCLIVDGKAYFTRQDVLEMFQAHHSQLPTATRKTADEPMLF